MSSVEGFSPLVSIIIPVYNGANYMRQAIDSALAQTYKNIEVIVINDGSTDQGQTERIACEYGNHIRYFSKQNGGCASALNVGIANMLGEYFSWLSHDDVYYPEKIEHQINILRFIERRDTILYGGWDCIDEQSKLKFTVQLDKGHSLRQLNTPLYPLLRGIIHGCALLIPSKYFREVGVFDESLPTTQDYALWFHMFRRAPLRYDPRILIKSRVHAEQGTHRVPSHVEECNRLWSRFLQQLNVEEMTAMEGSPYLFMSKTAKFLGSTPYDKARELAERKAKDIIEHTKVSIIIPFHNRIEWTIEALRSVQDQSHRALEIILVDDGSTEDLSRMYEACAQDARINLVKQEHGGPASARNYGVKLATGDYVAFLDSDDLYCGNKIETQLTFMEANLLDFSHTSYIKMDQAGKDLGTVDSGAFAEDVYPKIIAGCPIATPTVMVKRSILLSHRFPEDIEYGEDVCLWIDITGESRTGGIRSPLSKIRVSENSTARDAQKQRMRMLNILAHAIRHPCHQVHQQSIRSLALFLASLYGSEPKPEVLAARNSAWLSRLRTSRLRWKIKKFGWKLVDRLCNHHISPIIGHIDTPNRNQSPAELHHIAGWATSEVGCINRVDVMLDGRFHSTLVSGLPRPDVSIVHPRWAEGGCGFSGDFVISPPIDDLSRISVNVTDNVGFTRTLRIG